MLREGPPSSNSSEVEPETITFEYQVGEGVWTMPVHLQDLAASSWEHVSGAMLEAALLALYPGIFGRSTRVALAANGQMVRPQEMVGSFADPEINLTVVGHGAGPPLPEIRHLSNRRRPSSPMPMTGRGVRGGIMHGIPPLTRAFEAFSMEAENGDEDVWLPLRIEPAYLRIARLGRGRPRLLQLHVRATAVTVPVLEVALRRQFDYLLEGARVTLVRRTGEILTTTQQLVVAEEQILWAVVSDSLGSNQQTAPQEISTLVKEAQAHMHGRLKGNQIKLLVRGEQGLAGRLHKARFDPARQCALLLDAAARYDMHVSPARTDTTSASKNKPSSDTTEGEWQTAKRKPSRPVQVLSGESTGKHSKGSGMAMQVQPSVSARKPQYQLKAEQWSQPVMDTFVLDMPGVALAPTQEKAEGWAKQLTGTKQAVGIISIQPLSGAVHVEKQTIEIVETQSDKPDRIKVVGAFINSFSQHIIRYTGSIAEITRTSKPTTTMVLRARTQVSAVEKDQWAKCRKLTTPAEWRKFLKEKRSDLHVEDIFRLESTPTDISFMIRIHSQQEDEWLKGLQLPLSLSPTGDNLQKYKVTWDREATTLETMHKKFGQIPGFSGVVLSSKGLGARVKEALYQDARQKAGLAVGKVFLITGLPVDHSEQDIVTLMSECKWQVQAIPGSRKVKGQMTQVKVRAEADPPKTVLRVSSDREIYTLHIQEQLHPVRSPQRSEPEQPDNRTWADAVRTTLGRERSQQHTQHPSAHSRAAQAPNQPSQPTTGSPMQPQGGRNQRKRQQWADQQDEDDQDMDTSSAHESESGESFVPWNLFEEEGVRAADPLDDQFVEGRPRKKARKMSKKASAQQRGKRLRTLEQGLMAMQAQMSELVGALSQQQVVHMRTGPQRGTMPWPEGLELPSDAITRVPGDGNCLWHSLAVQANAQGAEHLPAGGLQLKEEYLTWMKEHSSEAAFLWGCEEAAIMPLIQYWQSEWADGRALLLASHLANVSVLLFNRHENCIEVFHAGRGAPLSGQVWTVLYDGSHYDSVRNPGPAEVARVREVMPMVPWKHNPKHPLKGGYRPNAKISPPSLRNLSLLRKKRHSPRKHTARLQVALMGGIMTWNIGGLRTNLDMVRGTLRERQPDLVALQETRVSKEHQAAVQHLLQREGYMTVWSRLSTWGLDKRGRHILRIGEIPGVALFYRHTLDVAVCPPRTPAGREYAAQGRLLMTHVALEKGERVMVMNVYAPSGHNQNEARMCMEDMIQQELATHAGEHCVLVGDFNQEVTQSNVHAQLQCQKGWRLPALVDEQLQPQKYTLEQDSPTWLDAILLSPGFMPQTPYQIALPALPRRHSPVLIPIPMQGTAHPMVARPPRIERVIQQEDDQDWEGLRKALEQESRKDKSPQEKTEIMWARWIQEVRNYLAPRVLLKGGKQVSDMGRCVLFQHPPDRSPKKDRSPMGICRHAIHKLHGFEPLSPRKWAWFLDNQETICHELGVTREDFLAAQAEPHHARVEWAGLLSQAEQRRRQEQQREWKETLSWKGSPSPKLFRWLRRQNPNPPLAVRHQERTLLGPSDTLEAMHEYWEGIMCREEEEREALKKWLEGQPPLKLQREDESRDGVLYEVIRSLKKGVAPGVDGWQAETLRLLPKRAIPALRYIYDCCVTWHCWPQQNMIVRTHMLPKDLDITSVIPTTADWRPIALTSLWMRVWSKWQLMLLPAELLEKFSPSLTGGLPHRNPKGSMLQYLLGLEESMMEPQEGLTWCSISVDASKCFDKIHQTQALQLAKG